MTVKNDGFCSRRPLTATRNTARAIPDSVERTSGSSVRLPTMVVVVSGLCPLLWLGVVRDCWWSAALSALAASMRRGFRGVLVVEASRHRLPSSSQSCSNCRMLPLSVAWAGGLPCAAANYLPSVGRTSTWTRACFRSAGRCAGPARDLRSVFQRRQHLDARRCCRSSAYRRDVAAVGGRASQGGPGVAGSCPGQQHAGPLQPHDAQADEQRRRGHGPVVG